jgi:hypothetical protein
MRVESPITCHQRKLFHLRRQESSEFALLLVTIFLCSATFLFSGEKNKNNADEMAGWICNAKSADQSPGKATCNTNCSEASGKVVFISERRPGLPDRWRTTAGKAGTTQLSYSPAHFSGEEGVIWGTRTPCCMNR